MRFDFTPVLLLETRAGEEALRAGKSAGRVKDER
jgi:hypothetical protein